MSDNILKLLGLHAQTTSQRTRYYGVYSAIVTNIKHESATATEPKGYRLKLKFPWLDDTVETYWGRQATFMGGANRGAFWMPEVDDEVLVAFEHGDFRFPVVIGQLWNGKDKYPEKLTITPKNKTLKIPLADQPTSGAKNDYRFIHSRQGHVLLFSDEDGKMRIVLRTNKSNEIVLEDTDGEEKIQIYDSKNENYVELDTVKKKITMESKTGEIIIKAFATITLDCKDLVTKSSKTTLQKSGKSYTIDSGTTMLIKSAQAMDIKAGGTMTLKAPMIKLN